MTTLDFPLARLNHQVWKLRLRSFLEGKETLTETQAVSHRDCELGQWLYGEGLKQYGDISEMQQLEKVHADLHNKISMVIRLQHSGNTSRAKQEFNKITPLSNEVVSLLRAVEKKVQS